MEHVWKVGDYFKDPEDGAIWVITEWAKDDEEHDFRCRHLHDLEDQTYTDIIENMHDCLPATEEDAFKFKLEM